MIKPGKNKSGPQNHEDASPMKMLESEITALRRDLRAAVRAYASRLEGELSAAAAGLRNYGPVDELSRERAQVQADHLRSTTG